MNFCGIHSYVSHVEPKKVYDALEDEDWVQAMHEELHNFERNKVWSQVERPKDALIRLKTSKASRNTTNDIHQKNVIGGLARPMYTRGQLLNFCPTGRTSRAG